MRVNVKSVFLGCKYALAQMLAQEAHPSGDRGWIINISSIMGIIAGPENRKLTILYVAKELCGKLILKSQHSKASYCASKGAVSQLTRQIALDYAPQKIHSNALCPGCKLPVFSTYRIRLFLGTCTNIYQIPKPPFSRKPPIIVPLGTISIADTH